MIVQEVVGGQITPLTAKASATPQMYMLHTSLSVSPDLWHASAKAEDDTGVITTVPAGGGSPPRNALVGVVACINIAPTRPIMIASLCATPRLASSRAA
jgi:hypothetical protein